MNALVCPSLVTVEAGEFLLKSRLKLSEELGNYCSQDESLESALWAISGAICHHISGEIIGILTYAAIQEGSHEYYHEIYIDTLFRGRGIGKGLLAQYELRMKELKVKDLKAYIHANNDVSRHFHLSHGFKEKRDFITHGEYIKHLF